MHVPPCPLSTLFAQQNLSRMASDALNEAHVTEHVLNSPEKSRVCITEPNNVSSSSPYIQSSKSPKKSPHSGGKSGHISTIKSLGLLHELQDYITSVESIAEGQKRELQRVREEKHQIEKVIISTTVKQRHFIRRCACCVSYQISPSS